MRDRRLRKGTTDVTVVRSGKASLGGVAGGGSGGAVSVSRAEVDVAAGVGSSARRRFKKPHGCDCESRMFMDTNVGWGFDGLDSLFGFDSFFVKIGRRQRVSAVADASGRCGDSHACKTSARASLRVLKRRTSAILLRAFSAKSSSKKLET